MILRYTVTPLGPSTSLYLEDLGDNEYTRGGSRVRTINNPFEFTESWHTHFWLVTRNAVSGISMQKRVNSVQKKKEKNQTFWLANNQRNSQIANQMRALNVATFKHAEICEWNNGRSFKCVFFRHRKNNLVAEKQL